MTTDCIRRGFSPRLAAIAGRAVLTMVVSSVCMKKPVATSHRRMRSDFSGVIGSQYRISPARVPPTVRRPQLEWAGRIAAVDVRQKTIMGKAYEGEELAAGAGMRAGDWCDGLREEGAARAGRREGGSRGRHHQERWFGAHVGQDAGRSRQGAGQVERRVEVRTPGI